MTAEETEDNRRIAATISRRVRIGDDPTVAGWQAMLANLLRQMSPYLAVGRLVTFQTLLPAEKMFFEALQGRVSVPTHVAALYIPPSVRHQMMGGLSATKAGMPLSPAQTASPDDGILLASRRNHYMTIVNVLFAHPPHTPAIDVYENGQLIAGYSYARLDTCREEINTILDRHLQPLRNSDH